MSGIVGLPLFDAWPMAFSASNDSYNGPLVFTFCINPLFRLEVHIHCNTKLLLSFSKIQCKTLYSQGGLLKNVYRSPPYSWRPLFLDVNPHYLGFIHLFVWSQVSSSES